MRGSVAASLKAKSIVATHSVGAAYFAFNEAAAEPHIFLDRAICPWDSSRTMELPIQFAGTHAVGGQEDQCVAQFEIGSYKNFVYLILDWQERKAAIVDPQHDLSAPLGFLKSFGFTLQAVLLTHTHFDHIAGLSELVDSYPHAPITVHRDDLHRIDPSVLSRGRTQLVSDGDHLEIGKLQIQVLHTPGHSAGECSYLLSHQVNHQVPFLFTGDTVFIRDCGRTDLPTGSTEQMFHTLQKLKKLEPHTVILPGHHYKKECASTLAKELVESPPFLCKSVEELAALP